MATGGYRDCGLFVDATSDDAVLELLQERLRVREEFGYLTVPGFELHVGRNQLAGRDGGDPDDFLDWRTDVDVYAQDETPDTEMVRFVAELMGLLRSAGHRVVAECDFAAELPQADRR